MQAPPELLQLPWLPPHWALAGRTAAAAQWGLVSSAEMLVIAAVLDTTYFLSISVSDAPAVIATYPLTPAIVGTLKLPPTFKFSLIPTPPVTINVPLVEVVLV
jgi:hypothetical protein